LLLVPDDKLREDAIVQLIAAGHGADEDTAILDEWLDARIAVGHFTGADDALTILIYSRVGINIHYVVAPQLGHLLNTHIPVVQFVHLEARRAEFLGHRIARVRPEA
jgi:hypothetical protein